MKPIELISEKEWLRYKRHLQLPGFDAKAQLAIKKASVLVIGAGGLGCPILLYLAAAGIGRLGVVDYDVIEIENLHRQILYSNADVGKSKAIVAGEKIKHLHPFVDIKIFNESIDFHNVISILSSFDIIVDGSDNFTTRYLLNDACVILQKPYIYGAVFQFEGQVSSFNILLKDGTRSCNYRNIYPEPPALGVIPSCAEGGVIGILPAIIGSVQALEVIKLVTGLGDMLVNITWIFDALSMESQRIKILNKKPVEIKEIIPIQNYCIPNQVREIDLEEAKKVYQSDYLLIDVRTEEERKVSHIGGIHLPLNCIREQFHLITESRKTLIFYCQSGKRSKEAVQLTQQISEGRINCLSLRGGLNNQIDLG